MTKMWIISDSKFPSYIENMMLGFIELSLLFSLFFFTFEATDRSWVAYFSIKTGNRSIQLALLCLKVTSERLGMLLSA